MVVVIIPYRRHLHRRVFRARLRENNENEHHGGVHAPVVYYIVTLIILHQVLGSALVPGVRFHVWRFFTLPDTITCRERLLRRGYAQFVAGRRGREVLNLSRDKTPRYVPSRRGKGRGEKTEQTMYLVWFLLGIIYFKNFMYRGR